MTGQSAAARGARLAAAYAPVSVHLDALIQKEFADTHHDHLAAPTDAARTIGLLAGAGPAAS